jgi:2-haloacid dehalogenase
MTQPLVASAENRTEDRSRLNFAQFKVLTFDCYGTLIDWETGIFGALRPLLAAHGKTVSDFQLLELYSELEAEAEGREFHAYREVLKTVVRGLGARLGFYPTENQIRSLPESLGSWPPFPDTVAALRRLQTRYKLAILSNVDDDLFAATACRLDVPFDQVITAQQARAYKPSLRIFELAEQRLGVPRLQWLHLGQSIYHDVIPAQSLGISTVWVNRASTRPGAGAVKAAAGKPDLEVADLQTLVRLAGIEAGN